MSENCSVRGIGVAGEGQRIDIDAHLRQLLLGRHAELLLLVDNKQSQVVEFHLLAQDLVRTDQDVDATLGQLRIGCGTSLSKTWSG